MLFSLLIIIYITFIALGLPDSFLGASFPAIAENLNISPDFAGYLSPIVACGTIVSSLFSNKLISKFGTRLVVFVSVLLTAIGACLFSFITEETLYFAYPICVVMGLGAGSIDAALNNYVALHYKAIHMNWLHCSWGIGASISPLIIGAFIDSNNNSSGWNWGILTISIMLFAVSLLLLVTLPLWNKAQKKEQEEGNIENVPFSYKALFKNPIFYLAMVGFFCYCGMESSTGLWLSTYMNTVKGIDTSLSASLASTFYLGITVGRFICGPISLKLSEKTMIRIGEFSGIIGILVLLIPFESAIPSMVGFVLIGISCAPIYPAIIRSTVYRFSRAASQKAMGLEMAIAYIGTLSMPPLFGLIGRSLGHNYSFLPYFILAFVIGMIACHETINIKLRARDKNMSPEELEQYKTTS